ncbi:hypothetical protein [Pseudalkalibacillus salsuginis]|uniref:hypothetical protein n=1 Tax=Pseudalkalibacillus salsuginis TaxID=2910972 RepID=UPI001F3B8928|nr:hypothetical protein [Pseudalkalibacillus salsuginis]MCF6408877.1 hypothetical protein [Pseudalkalibacillus salsuginis]
MKKSIAPLIIGMFIAFALFWVGHPASSTSFQIGGGSELPKKTFSKSQIEVQNEPLAMNANLEYANEEEKVKTTSTGSNINVEAPNKSDFVQIAETFMQEVVQPTDVNYKVSDFDTKQGLVRYLNQYVSEKVAKYYVDGLYQEEQDGLYIIPTELPPWIEKGNPSTLKKVDENHYQLEQNNSSDLYGDYFIQLNFKKNGDNWIIESVNVQ